MEPTDQSPDTAPAQKASITSIFRRTLLTLVLLAAVWIGLRYAIMPMVMPKTPGDALVPGAAYEERIKALEDKIITLENKEMPQAPDVSALEARLAALEARPAEISATPAEAPIDRETIEALKADIQALKSAGHATVRSLILTGQLQDAIRAGRPFASELAALQALRPDLKELLSPSEAYSITGVATLAQLQEYFSRAIGQALAPAGEKSLVGNLKSLVTIRKVGEAQKGADDEAVLARAEAKLAEGNVAAALQETETLSAPAALKLASWQTQAKHYLAAQALITQLQTQMGTEPHE